MQVSATTEAPRDTACDTIVIGVFEGKGIPHDLDGAPLGALLESGEARDKPGHLALTHAEGKRWLLIGCGSRDAFGAEEARVAAAAVVGRCRSWERGRCAGSSPTRSPTPWWPAWSRAPSWPPTG